MRRVLRAFIAAVAASLLGATVAFAAGFSVDARDLSTYASNAQIPALSTCTVSSSADTYVDQFVLSGTYGSATTMQVASAALANKRALVSFDLTPCSFAATADVISASLGLYLDTAPAVSRTYQTHRVTGAWVEAAVTWNTQPSVAGSATASVATGTTNGVTLNFDVKADVKSFVEGASTNYGWRVADASEGSVTARTGGFRTREHATSSTRPSLTITYYP